MFPAVERLRLILAFVGLILLWLLTLLFFSFDSTRIVTYIASGFLFVLAFGLLVIFLRTALRPADKVNQLAKKNFNLELTSFQPKRQPNETEFLSQTFETVLVQMQEQQKELTILQNKSNERAVSAEVFSHHIVNSLPSGLIAFDAQGKVRIANTPAREIFPLLQTQNARKITYGELFRSNDNLLNLVSESLNNGTVFLRTEIDYQTQNQKKRLGLTVAPLEIEKAICGVLCLFADITEIALLREQSERQRNLESLGVMSAGLAHELKNALATLHSYSQFLGRSAQSEPSKNAASALAGEIRNLSEMINSFLNFARPQALSLMAVNLDTVIAECIGEITVYAEQNKVSLEVSGEFAVVQADNTMIRQTILNLLRNAVEAAADSEIKKVKVKGYVSIDDSLQRWVNIEVKDTGAGVKEEDLDFIFVPFFTTKQYGHGIGLALAHRIITQHSGMLTAANDATGGAVFTIKLKI